MPETIRLVAIDVDGTLLDSADTVRPRVARAVQASIAAGCRIVLATGRRLASAAPIAAQLGLSTLILLDGAVVYDLAIERTLFERALPSPLLARAVDLVQQTDLPPVLLESPAAGARIFAGPPDLDNPETSGYLSRRRDEVVRLSLDQLKKLERVVRVLGMGGTAPFDQLASMAGAAHGLSTTVWASSAAGYRTEVLEIGPPGVSKGQALLWLAEHLGVPRSQTMAIGDYDNDASMVEAAAVGIAMGHATASVKAVARAVVADNDGDGVAQALEEWVLRTTAPGE